MNNKVYMVVFSVDSVFCQYDKVLEIFAREEDAQSYLRKEADERISVLTNDGYKVPIDTPNKVYIENAETNEDEIFYIEEREVK